MNRSGRTLVGGRCGHFVQSAIAMIEKLEFSMTPEDLEAFKQLYFRKVSNLGNVRGLLAWFLIVACLVLVYLLLRQPSGLGQIVLSLLPVVAVLGLIVFFLRRALLRVTKGEVQRMRKTGDLKKLTALQQLVVKAEGVEFSSEFGTTFLPWKAIPRIEHTPSHLFIFNTSQSAHVVPARAFADPQAFETFVREIRLRHTSSPPLTPTCPTCGFNLQHALSAGCPECGWQRQS